MQLIYLCLFPCSDLRCELVVELPSLATPNTHSMVTRSKTGSLNPHVFTTTNTIILPKPKSYIEAQGVLEWKKDIRKEFKASIDNKN